jgi:hypothetical protein
MPNGGVYLVEDLHAPESGSFLGYVRGMSFPIGEGIGLTGLFFFPSVVVLERGAFSRPTEVSR